MELVAGQAELVLDCFMNPQSALCPFSSRSDVFYSPFPHPFPAQTDGGTSPTKSSQTGAHALPGLCGPPISVLGELVSCRCPGLGQRKSTPSSLHISLKGPLPPSFSCPARQRHSRKPVTHHRQRQPQGMEGDSAQRGGSAHSAILLC